MAFVLLPPSSPHRVASTEIYTRFTGKISSRHRDISISTVPTNPSKRMQEFRSKSLKLAVSGALALAIWLSGTVFSDYGENRQNHHARDPHALSTRQPPNPTSASPAGRPPQAWHVAAPRAAGHPADLRKPGGQATTRLVGHRSPSRGRASRVTKWSGRATTRWPAATSRLTAAAHSARPSRRVTPRPTAARLATVVHPARPSGSGYRPPGRSPPLHGSPATHVASRPGRRATPRPLPARPATPWLAALGWLALGWTPAV
ncbi:hypothetical protein KSP39_PZI014640 [Platanthera zijinensis]|uniref:Uncharacterized protein n=1 Tax=Platanthera zijinensis TaxID=2320716 RepID=A0AAP0BAC8_9ASPA